MDISATTTALEFHILKMCTSSVSKISVKISTLMALRWRLSSRQVLNSPRLLPNIAEGSQVHANFVCFVFTSVFASSQQINVRNFQRQEHSLIKPYQGSGLAVSHWYFMESTNITNNYRLTPASQCKPRAIWDNVPCLIEAGSCTPSVKLRAEIAHWRRSRCLVYQK